MTEPIFILSLPRSGSTLLQRLLLNSGECATLGEPSFLLRLLDNPPHTQRLALYWESLLEKSFEDFHSDHPEFDAHYKACVQTFARSLYSELARGNRYFIDKTPRYTLIARQIIETFPDAKIIVLWRHPGAIADSLARAYRDGKWCLKEFEIDLFAGLDNLHETSIAYPDRIYQLRYEDLTAKPEVALADLSQYLEIDDLASYALKEVPQSAGGQLGDQTGKKTYSHISPDSNDQWIKHLNNWYRRHWLKRIFDNQRSPWLNELGYIFPPERIAHPLGLLQGCRECVSQFRRQARRQRKPKSRKMEKCYRKNQKHSATFR